MFKRLTRRSFIRWAAGTGMGLGARVRKLIASTQATRATRPAENPSFSFIQWNDVHLDASEPSGYELANAKMDYLLEWINQGNQLVRPDFVIGIGDMVHGGDLQSLSPDTRLLKRDLDHLSIPFYPVIGNHENVQQEDSREHEAAFREAFGEDRGNYTVEHKGVLFVMLNNSGAPQSNSREVGRRRNAWLHRILESSGGLPKILCCHIPLVPLRDESVLARSFGFVSYAAKDDQLLDLVDSHAGSILAVLSGHLHLTGMVVRKGVHHVCIAGTASYPCEFASYEVFPDRIRMCVHSLPETLLTRRTDIHGRRRHGIDYTDSQHETHESYIKGNPGERSVDIPR